MAKTICTILGILFLIAGLLGFAAPGMMGMHLSVAHNVIHLVSGALALYFGSRGTYDAARTFCIVFGIVYGLLGLMGFLAGGADYMLTLLPGQLMLGKMDHIVHIILAILFIIGGLSPRPVVIDSTVERGTYR
jgi:hypothetical protein